MLLDETFNLTLWFSTNPIGLFRKRIESVGELFQKHFLVLRQRHLKVGEYYYLYSGFRTKVVFSSPSIFDALTQSVTMAPMNPDSFESIILAKGSYAFSFTLWTKRLFATMG